MNEIYKMEELPSEVVTDSGITIQVQPVNGNNIGRPYGLSWAFTCNGNTTTGTIANNLTDTSYSWTPTSSIFGPLMPNQESGTLVITASVNNFFSESSTVLKLNSRYTPYCEISISKENTFNDESISGITTHKATIRLMDLLGASQNIYIGMSGSGFGKSLNVSAGETSVEVDLGCFTATGSDAAYVTPFVQITDSRGRYRQITSDAIAIYPYSPPRITKVSVERNEQEQPVLTYEYTYQSTVAGAANVIKTFLAKCSTDSGLTETDLKDKTSPQVLRGTYELDEAYEFIISLQDSVKTSAVIGKAYLPSYIPILDIGADGKTVTFFGTSPSSAMSKSLRIADKMLLCEDYIQLSTGDNGQSGIKVNYGFLNLFTGDVNSNTHLYMGGADDSSSTIKLTVGDESNPDSKICMEDDRIYLKTTGVSGEIFLDADYEIRLTSKKVNVSNLTLPLNATSWLGGKTSNDCIVASQQSASSYHPVLRVNTSGNNVWNIGGLGNDVGIYGYYAGRTDNGYDFSTTWNTSNGTLTHNKDMAVNGTLWLKHNIAMNNDKAIYFRDSGGTTRTVVYVNSNNDVMFGAGFRELNQGCTYLSGGSDIQFRIGSKNKLWRPYYTAGDSFSIWMRTAGFISSASKSVYFSIPLTKPLIGVSAVSASFVNGLIVRQNGKYLYGSSSTVSVKPSSIQAGLSADNQVVVTANMPNATNVAYNNDACGLDFTITLTFS